MKRRGIVPHQILQTLGEPNRFRIMKLLLKSEVEICNCEFVDCLKLPKYTLSKHLNALIKAGVLTSRKEGRWVYYSACVMSDAFCDAICDAIRNVSGSIYEDDFKRLNERLNLRKEGKCFSVFRYNLHLWKQV